MMNMQNMMRQVSKNFKTMGSKSQAEWLATEFVGTSAQNLVQLLP